MLAVIPLILAVFTGFCFYRIVGKAGYNPWLGLLILVPVVHLGFLAWFAFAEWPVHQNQAGSPD